MRRRVSALFLGTALLCGIVAAQPLPGQIVVDPANPAWLRYQGGGSFFLCAPGEPEDFLYRGTQNSDGTRTGDQQALIDILIPTGANGIYLQAIRSHGGDGNSTHNPFVGNDPALGLNTAVLDQWEGWFDQMDAAGITIYFFIYDDSARIWGSEGGGLEPEEAPFISALVNRFEHHLHLIWIVAEEYQERWSQSEASELASIIRDADDHDHPIAVHELTGLITDFPDDPSVDQSAIQWGETDPDSLHDDVGVAWDDAAGRFNLNLAEARDWGTGDLARQLGWAVAMAGAYFMPIDWDIVNTPTQRLLECGYLRHFFEQAELSALAPADHLAAGATNYVLANEGAVYLAYSREPNDLGLTNLPPGQPLQRWLDVRSGAIEETAIQVAGGTVFFARPAGIGQEAALYLDYGGAELFADGFESADTTAWSTTVP